MADNLAGVVKTTFEVNLDIPHIQIEHVEVDREGHYRITVNSTECGTYCHKCGHFIDHFYSHGEFITLRSCAKTQLPKPPLKRSLVIMLALYKFFAA